MYRLHFQRNLRSLLFVAVAVAVLALPVLVWWVNHTGLPESWRHTIQTQLAKDGMHVRIGSLRYAPLKGLVATEVEFFSDETHRQKYARVEQVVVGFDKTKLARGEVQVTRLKLINATFEMEFAEEGKEPEVFGVTELRGVLLIEEGRRFEVKQMTGRVEGVEVEINARLVGRRPGGGGARAKSNADARRQFVARVLKELAAWNLDGAGDPSLRIWVEGDLAKPSSLRSRGVLEVGRIERNGVALEDLVVEGEARDSVITITSLTANDGLGHFEGRMDYDLEEKVGRFECGSSVDLLAVLGAWFGVKQPGQVLVGGSRELVAEGTLRVTEAGKLSLATSGQVKCGSVMAQGILLDQVESRFAWENGSLYLRELRVERADGLAVGKVMVEWPKVRLAFHSTIPAAVYQPLFAGKPLGDVIGDFSAGEDAVCEVDLEGGFDAGDRRSWAYAGSVALRGMDFRGVPLSHVSCDLALSSDELDFTDGVIGFDYWKYPPRIRYQGPKEAEAKVGRVRFRRTDKLVDIENVRGRFWAPPMIRLFATKTADLVESYRFHQPPELRADGVVDVTPGGRTSLVVDFESDSAATTELLGRDVVLGMPKGAVKVTGSGVEVSGLTGTLFDGPVQAEIRTGNGGKLGVESSWTRLSLPAIAEAYDLQLKAGGRLTGRVEFEMIRGEIGTLQGNGLLGLEESELFSVPMFGPLSVVIGGVLNDKKAGFETADSAFCNFRIDDGVMETRDFSTSTRSLVFGGDGKVDLTDQTMDMTMRMNARGLLGLLTIPLRPFYGMFQFRGTGPLRKPEWQNVMFTAPPKEQVEMLNAPPRARIVEP